MSVKREVELFQVEDAHPFIRPPYWRSPADAGIAFDPDEGLTQQQFKDECDINNIMKRYAATGGITHLNMRQPEYGDFSNPIDFQNGLNTVIEAQELFAAMPANIRDRFNNNPMALLEFMADEKNFDEAVSLGIVKAPEKEPEPMKVRVVPDEATPPTPPQPKAP